MCGLDKYRDGRPPKVIINLSTNRAQRSLLRLRIVSGGALNSTHYYYNDVLRPSAADPHPSHPLNSKIIIAFVFNVTQEFTFPLPKHAQMMCVVAMSKNLELLMTAPAIDTICHIGSTLLTLYRTTSTKVNLFCCRFQFSHSHCLLRW